MMAMEGEKRRAELTPPSKEKQTMKYQNSRESPD
jgi:hypothetical protein